MIVMRQEDGLTILSGREESEWIIAPWWPCSGDALRRVAPDKLPKAFVDEAASFANAKYLGDDE